MDQEADEEGGWEADDVEVVALDALDQARAQALDRIAARSSLPLAAADVVGQVPRGQRPERDRRHLVLELLPPGRDEAEPRDDLVRAARQPLEHPLGLGRVAGLAEGPPVDDDRRVDTEHGALVTQPDRVRLAARVLAHELHRIGIRRVALLVARSDDGERQPELLENRPPLRRDGCENDRRSRRNAHPRLRAFQISSAGHLRAHSAETKS